MAPILLYLLKANAVLVLVAAAYYGLLRRLTFFGLNRAYLLLALLFAAVYPALPVPALLPAKALVALPAPLLAGASPALASPAVGSAPAFDWLALGLGVYALGTGLLLLRLLAQLLSLARVHRWARPAVVLGQPVRVLAAPGGPFSFGRSIYLSEATLADAANLPAVLRHEQAHVRQHHTLDVLLTQVALALAWANPAAWLLRRAVLDNLEYLADREALHTGLDRRAYQYSLLRQQPGWVPAPALAFHFSFLTLKNRITMLNQPASTTRQLGRYLLAAPLVMALALGYSGARAQVAPTPAPMEKPALKNATIYVDGKLYTKGDLNTLDPNSINNIEVLKEEAERKAFANSAGKGTVVITTKANADSPDVVAFNKRIRAAVPTTPAVIHPEFPANALWYLDGQPSSKQAVDNLPSSTVFNIDVIQDEPATIKRLFGNTTATSAVIVTTDANANSPAVLALAEKGDLGSGYTRTPAQINAVVPKALAYITSHYPDARLSGDVMEVKKKTTGVIKYQVQLVRGRRPFYVYFTPQGDFLSEAKP